MEPEDPALLSDVKIEIDVAEEPEDYGTAEDDARCK
jgi:hypothetical protein